MEIIYKAPDFTERGDDNLLNGLEEINKRDYKKALRHFEKGCTMNNEYSLVLAASLYFMGYGNVVPDPSKAAYFYTKAASNFNNSVAQYMIGMMYFAGYGVTQNYKKAIRWFEISCKNGWSYAQARMGLIFELGYGVKIDHEKAELWYGQLFAREEELRPKNDKLFHLFGYEKLKIDFSKVKKQTFQIATTTVAANMTSLPRSMMSYKLTGMEALGECIFWSMMSNTFLCIPASQYEFGLMHNNIYNDMHGIDNDMINDSKALEWIRKASENGNMHAQAYLGKNYERGVIVKKNYVEALKWYRASHAQGNPEVLYGIGCLYFYGHDGVEQDLKEAFSVFQKILELVEHGEACIKIGALHEVGKQGVVDQNFKKAFDYFRRAADAGVGLGYANMGLYYLEGRRGISVDYKKAFDCLSTAADMGCSHGQYGLATMYTFGFYVEVDLDRALKLFKKARDNGFPEAQGAINMVKEMKSPDNSVKSLTLSKQDYERFIKIIENTEKKTDSCKGKKKGNKKK